MKYKLKIEFDYRGLDKDQIRDCKLELLSKDLTTIIESDYPIHIPNKDDIIKMDGDRCKIKGISHSIDKLYYSTTIFIVNSTIENFLYDKNIKLQKEKADQDLEYYRRKNLLKSFF